MAESCLRNSSSNASSSRLKQQNQFPLPALSKEANHFFQEAPLQQSPGIEGVQPVVTGVLFSKVNPIVQAIQGKGKNYSSLHPVNPSKPVRNPPAGTDLYVPRTFKTTYRGQNISFLSELAEHYKRPLGSGYCSGVQDRVSGISSPVLHSEHACIRGGEGLN